MRPSLCCRSCLACILKLLNFLQSFVGISLILYSVWVLNSWNRHRPAGPDGGSLRLGFDLDDLPAPWFVCAVMGFGAVLCVVSFMGHVAAEVVNGCCLCFYVVLTSLVILLEASLGGYLVFNKQWEQDLPYDPTGELKRLHAFIEDNIDVFKWVAAAVIAIQALSLLLALFVRVLIPSRRADYDSDEDFVVIRRPLLNPQGSPFTLASVENKGFHSDIWSSRMRQKYGLNHSDYSYNPAGATGQNAPVPTNSAIGS